MSEYQHYEFQTVGRRLTEKEMRALRAVSSRGEITPTSYSNEYDFGDFKGDPDDWMEKYFDGFLYLANWGTRELQLALPQELLPRKSVREYCSDEGLSVRERAGKVIVKFLLQQEEPDAEWLEGEGSLSSLLPIRDELARGDFRSLYLGWLMAVQTDCLEEDALEPEVPPNLGQLTAAQLHFVDFFGIDQDLLAAAAMNSPLIHSEPREHEELSAWIKSLPAEEKDLFLSRVVSEDAGKVALELQSRFFRQRKSQSSGAAPKRRAATELLAAADDLREARTEKQRKKAAQERERKEREAAKAREKHLASLEGKSEELWENVNELVATRLPKNYALTIALLVDLRDLARRENHSQEFYNRLQEFRTQHSTKSALMRRIAEAGL